MNKPLIGVLPLFDTEKDSYWMLPGYMEGVLQAGGIPVMLPLTCDEEHLAQLAGQLDGFLITGGQDVAPAMYGEAQLPLCGECYAPRDTMEQRLFARVWDMDKPVLGICRGIQLMNAALGGTLYQDLPSQIGSAVTHAQTPPYDQPAHQVRIVEDTPLHALLTQNEIPVNSCHHQAVKALAPALRPMAYAPDGVVEAVYAPDKKFVWGVQWHPECCLSGDENSRRLFASFLAAMQ